ncbi:MAG: hypothetical protein NZ938_01620 [Aigarchaeota archaeon]|nr:hypothetical protein [Candidatus Calditenuaceae archaeon]
MLTALERALLSREASGQSGWRNSCLVVDETEGGSFTLFLAEGLDEGAAVHRLACHFGRFPLRAGAVNCAAVRHRGDPATLSATVLEVNRALIDGAPMTLTARLEDPERFLVKHGFALVSEHKLEGGGEAAVTLSRKAWRKYLGEACPRCGSTLVLPLIPPDADVRKVWTVYCPSCSYNWSIEEPITEWI